MILREIADRIPKGFTVEVDQRYVECTEGSSNKYYHIISVCNRTAEDLTNMPTVVMSNYGPMGKLGSGSFDNFETKESAEKFLSKKLNGKIRKGYSHASPPPNRTMKGYKAHEFGRNAPKDEVFLTVLEHAIGTDVWLEKVLTGIGAFDKTLVNSDAKPKQNEDVVKLEEERKTVYSNTWGAWA